MACGDQTMVTRRRLSFTLATPRTEPLRHVLNLLPMSRSWCHARFNTSPAFFRPFGRCEHFGRLATGDQFVTYLLVGSIVGAVAIAMAAALFDRRLLRRA